MKNLQTKPAQVIFASLLFGVSLALATPGLAFAKGGGNQPRHTGFVQSRPAGKVGTWVVGGNSFRATASTQLDQLEGQLRVGTCAKVKYRAGTNIAIEIDSEPASDC